MLLSLKIGILRYAQKQEVVLVYNSQTVAERIKSTCTDRKISVAKMLSECAIAKNTIGNLAAGSDLTLSNAFKIADYLDVSVDFLLGRTDKPEVNR